MVPSLPSGSRRTASRLLGGVGAALGVLAAAWLLGSFLTSDAFVSAWVLGGALVAVAGGIAAWTGRRATLLAAALLLTAFVVVGAMSVGFLFAPAATCLLGAALLSGWAGPVFTPGTGAPTPTRRTVAVQALTGVAAVGGGAWLVRLAALDRELFGACASETPACVLATTNWVAVAATVLGLVAVVFGGWLLLRQAVAVRALASGPGAT